MAKKIVKRVQPTKKVVGKVKKAPPPKKPVSVRKPAPVKAAPKTVVRKKTAASTETQLKVIDKDLVKLLNKRMELMTSRESTANGWGYYSRADIDAWNAFAFQGGIIEKKLDNVDAVYTNKFVADFNKFDAADISKRAKAWRP